MYHMDETGFSIGCIKAVKAVVNKNLESKRQARPGWQEWLSQIEWVRAAETRTSKKVFELFNLSGHHKVGENRMGRELTQSARGSIDREHSRWLARFRISSIKSSPS